MAFPRPRRTETLEDRKIRTRHTPCDETRTRHTPCDDIVTTHGVCRLLEKDLAVAKWGPLRFSTPGELRRAGVLGINRRNGEYILPHNPRQHYPRVDDKYLTKQLCHARQIPVPETYALIERHGDVPKFLDLVGDRGQFVIKPASGSEGRGIMVIARHDGREFFSSGDERGCWPT